MQYLQYAVLFLLLADVVTTLAILRKGGYERNPVMRWLMDRMGTAPALVISHGIMAVGILWCPGYQAIDILVIVTVIYGALLVDNLDVLRKLRA